MFFLLQFLLFRSDIICTLTKIPLILTHVQQVNTTAHNYGTLNLSFENHITSLHSMRILYLPKLSVLWGYRFYVTKQYRERTSFVYFSSKMS